MVRTAVTENYGFNQRSPAKVIDMIERSASRDQRTHDINMAQMRRCDQRGAVIRASNIVRPVAARERDLHARGVVGHSRYGDSIVPLRIERIGIGAQPHQCGCGCALLLEYCDM